MNGIFPAQVDFFLVRNLPQIHRRNFFFDDFSWEENGRDVIAIFPTCNWRTVHFDYLYIKGSCKTTTAHHSTPQANPPPSEKIFKTWKAQRNRLHAPWLLSKVPGSTWVRGTRHIWGILLQQMLPILLYFVFLRLSGRFGQVPFIPNCNKVVIKD